MECSTDGKRDSANRKAFYQKKDTEDSMKHSGLFVAACCMKVEKISKRTASLFICEKHYSHKMPIFWYGFGLVIDGLIEGVVVYGQPSPPLQLHSFSDKKIRVVELSRLVIQTKEKNAASFLVGNSLRMLPSPCAVVSYADTEYNHCGYIYQATNFIYTGATVSHDRNYVVDGKRLHPMTLRDMGITSPAKWAKENGIQTVKPLKKHRYFYFNGTRKEKKHMKECLNYEQIAEYPKGNPVRYDDGRDIITKE